MLNFKGMRFPIDVILVCIRWYAAYLTMPFPSGKLVVVMGGSGSGKTTILRLIGGMLMPQSGRIHIDVVLLDTHDTAWL